VLKSDRQRTESLAFEFAWQDLGERFPKFQTARCATTGPRPTGGDACFAAGQNVSARVPTRHAESVRHDPVLG
jgi:hypothetical protein